MAHRFPYAQVGTTTLTLLLLTALGSCSSDSDDEDPDTLSNLGPVISTRYDSGDDGLLAGLGLSGIVTPPERFYADPAAPTLAELRRNAIQSNYAALVDTATPGGFGTLYGPTDDTTYPGTEYLAFIGAGDNRAALMVQVPDSFDTAAPCIVVAPSSGSRGVYGAVGTGGAFGLEHGCAVAYTDANKGTGAVDLDSNTGYSLQLAAIDLATTTEEATFRVPTRDSADSSDDDHAGVSPPTTAELAAFIETYPHRFAFKHAHSQKNIEKDWGRHAIESAEFAFSILNEHHGGPYTRDNTLVIGASVSNGGSALLRAVEQSEPDLFDGVVVGEPNITPASPAVPITIAMGEREPFIAAGQSVIDYFMVAELYAACASKAPAVSGVLFAELRGDAQARCAALVAAGLLEGSTPEEQGNDALARLMAAGYLPESLGIVVGYAGIDLFQSLITTYMNAYTRSSVVDDLCHISMAHVDLAAATGAPAAHPALPTLAALSSGIPRTADVYLIKDDAPLGPTLQFMALSGTTGTADYNLEGALCWQDIVQNADNPLYPRLQQGVEEIRATARLQGVPTIMVHGRADGLIPVNHSSRPYYATNKALEGDDSPLYYYEIEHAQHLDAFNASYAATGMPFVPIDYYFRSALTLMLDHLQHGTPLPPSQVVPTRAPVDGLLVAADLVAIAAEPDKPIHYADAVLVIPE